MCSFATKQFKKGDLIIKEGDTAATAFVINKGHVEVKKITLKGESVLIARLDPGQIFGEMSLFDNSNRSASVYALSDVELSVITKEDFLKYLDNTPPQIKVIIELLLKRLRQTSNLVTLIKTEDNISKKDQKDILEQSIKEIDFPT